MWEQGIKRKRCSLEFNWSDLQLVIGWPCWLDGKNQHIGLLLTSLLWRREINFIDLIGLKSFIYPIYTDLLNSKIEAFI